MDKEFLLRKFQERYLTRQGVLFKLPLNIPIDTFWPELLERRKMNGIVLPLHRADGKPYWYVLTDKMISASEKLCALAIDNNDMIDPFHTGMTPALTEEVFYTSFVEGAQITMKEAQDFLNRGTEPENVQEQLIRNNQNALTDMMKMLYYPLDERFIRTLAFLLTNEMEGHAADYRQNDNHMIAAMGNETYEIPTAGTLPTLMKEYYDFLANPEIHPLIKAAIGQAYLLVARPFPDGNERLGRMISYAVLLRSGYDFFSDISISGMIARENFLYFRSMQDIIRTENGGDLTYFIEYFLDMLARSVDAKAEQNQRRMQTALERERQAAKLPFERPDPTPPPKGKTKKPSPKEDSPKEESSPKQKDVPQTKGEKKDAPSKKTAQASGAELSIITEAAGLSGQDAQSYSKMEYMIYLENSLEKYNGKIDLGRKTRIFNNLYDYASTQPAPFTASDWAIKNGISKGVAGTDCVHMEKLGLIVRQGFTNSLAAVYTLPIRLAEPVNSATENTPSRTIKMETFITKLMKCTRLRERKIAEGVRGLLNEGKISFQRNDWLEKNKDTNRIEANRRLSIACEYGIVEYEDNNYLIRDSVNRDSLILSIPKKLREIILKLMEVFPNKKFTLQDASSALNIHRSSMSWYLETLLIREILSTTMTKEKVLYYEFANEVYGIYEAVQEKGNNAVFRQLPLEEKEQYDPLKGVSEAG